AGHLQLPRLSLGDPSARVPAPEPRKHARARIQGEGQHRHAARSGDAQSDRPLQPRHRRHRPRATSAGDRRARQRKAGQQSDRLSALRRRAGHRQARDRAVDLAVEVRLDPKGPFKRDPLAPHQMVERLTPTKDVIVLCHLGVPRLDAGSWTLSIDGLVERPLTWRLNDLISYPKAEIASVHECCGSPLARFEPTGGAGNVTGGGTRLTDILGDCRPRGGARYVWSYGADRGEFAGAALDAYVKDLPISRIADDVLIAY